MFELQKTIQTSLKQIVVKSGVMMNKFDEMYGIALEYKLVPVSNLVTNEVVDAEFKRRFDYLDLFSYRTVYKAHASELASSAFTEEVAQRVG